LDVHGRQMKAATRRRWSKDAVPASLTARRKARLPLNYQPVVEDDEALTGVACLHASRRTSEPIVPGVIAKMARGRLMHGVVNEYAAIVVQKCYLAGAGQLGGYRALLRLPVDIRPFGGWSS